MNDPDTINQALLAPFDTSLIEDKQGKRYIGHEHVRMRVIEATGNQFEWHVASMEYRDDGAIRARSSGNVPPVMIVTGTLTIPGLGARSGTGVQVIEAGAGEDTYKAAESDAFKRAGMAFGIGLQQLYMNGHVPQPQNVAQRPPRRAQGASALPEQAARMSVEQFRNAFAAALLNKHREELKRLMESAGDDQTRWTTMAAVTTDPKQIDWIIAEMDKAGVMPGPEFNDQVATHRASLG